MNKLIWIICIILMAFYSFTAYPSGVTLYELIIDFGNDFAFIHETTGSKIKCMNRVKEIRSEFKNKTLRIYCIQRRN